MDDVRTDVSTEIAPLQSAMSPSDDLIGREYQAAFAGGGSGGGSPSERPDGPAPELWPGTKLGERYTIVRKLGQGGMGVVYEARNANVEHIRYAIKTLLRGGSKTDAEHFLQEAKRASKVRSKHIVRISDFGTDSASGLTYMVMDYVGSDLETYMGDRGGKLPPRQAIEFCVQVCEALAAAHGEKVVHRDIKPSNCLVHVEAGQEIIVVTDFGIAREFRTAASSDASCQTDGLWTAIGTAGYIAPEVLLREPRADHRVDIYSLGAMLFRMLVGRSPLLAPTVEELLTAGIPSALLPVLGTALARSPRDRYATARAMQTALREVQASFAVTPTVVPARMPASRSLRLLTAVMLLAIIACLIYVSWPGNPGNPGNPDEVPPSPMSIEVRPTDDRKTEPTKPHRKTEPTKPELTPDSTDDSKEYRPPVVVRDEVATKPVKAKTEPRPRPLPAFAKVSPRYTDILRNFCKQGILRCADTLEIKQQQLYRSKGSFLSRVGFSFSAKVGDPSLMSRHQNLDLTVEPLFKACVNAELRNFRFEATSDGGSFECNVAL